MLRAYLSFRFVERPIRRWASGKFEPDVVRPVPERARELAPAAQACQWGSINGDVQVLGQIPRCEEAASVATSWLQPAVAAASANQASGPCPPCEAP